MTAAPRSLMRRYDVVVWSVDRAMDLWRIEADEADLADCVDKANNQRKKFRRRTHGDEAILVAVVKKERR